MSDDPFLAGKGPQRGQILFALAFAGFAIFILSNLGNQTEWVERSTLFAQPGFWPGIAGTGMVLFGLLHLRGLRRGKGMRRPWISRADRAEARIWLRPLEYTAWFMVYVLAVPRIGHLPATMIFAPALTWRLGYRNPRLLWAAVVFAVVVVVIFKGLLGVKIPGGAIYEYLPDGLRAFALRYL
ncbi:MAG: tripartite tricarboxylate transporter TctB family protein [Alphaproteobacteria bacterium]